MNSVRKVKELVLKYYSSNKVINELLSVYETEINNKRDLEKINFKIIGNVVKIIKEVRHYSQNIEQKQFLIGLPNDTTKSKIREK